MKLDGILNNENIPKGISSQGRRNLVDKGNKYAFDENGNPNFVSIHGFLIYDSNKNAYMLLDNKPGIKEFVENNKEQFDLLNKKFNLKAVLVGGEPLELSDTDKKDKEQNDFINQIRGEVYLKGYRPTTMPLNNSSEISSDKFLEILTNPRSHEKFISGK